MLSKRYESTEVDYRNLLHVLSGTLWSTSNTISQLNSIDTCDLSAVKLVFSVLIVIIVHAGDADDEAVVWTLKCFWLVIIIGITYIRKCSRLDKHFPRISNVNRIYIKYR